MSTREKPSDADTVDAAGAADTVGPVKTTDGTDAVSPADARPPANAADPTGGVGAVDGEDDDGANDEETVDAGALTRQVAACRAFLQVADGYLPPGILEPASTAVERADSRLHHSSAHTVIALAGTTGSGKSSIFNGLVGRPLSRVGVRRPTTGVTHACIWNATDNGPLLDWLEVPPDRRYGSNEPLHGAASGLKGLVLLDLPDFDSIEQAHRREVDRIIHLVDLVVWVLDPQKYADQLLHEQYLRPSSRQRDITLVTLNQVDLLSADDSRRCLADLRRLLDADGLAGVPLLTTSTVTPGGLDALRAALEQGVTASGSNLWRLAAELDAVRSELMPLVATPAPREAVDRGAVRQVIDELATVAGVPALIEAADADYRREAAAFIDSPASRWTRRWRTGPARGTKSPGESGPQPPSDASSPKPGAAQWAAVAAAAQDLVGSTTASLPGPWQAAARTAARAREDEVPAALEHAIAATRLPTIRQPGWWRAIWVLQWLAIVAAAGSLLWLVASLAGLTNPLGGTRAGGSGYRAPVIMLATALAVSLLLPALARPVVGLIAHRHRRIVERRLRTAIAEVVSDLVVAPVRAVIDRYGEARAALARADDPDRPAHSR